MPVWGWMLLAILAIAGGFWFDVRLGLVLLEALPVLGGGAALYKVIRTANSEPPPPSHTNRDDS